MSLYQCQRCGCIENTALGDFWGQREKLCSACSPEMDKWHGKFDRRYLPHGDFVKNRDGNLIHKETGEGSLVFERVAEWPAEGRNTKCPG